MSKKRKYNYSDYGPILYVRGVKKINLNRLDKMKTRKELKNLGQLLNLIIESYWAYDDAQWKARNEKGYKGV